MAEEETEAPSTAPAEVPAPAPVSACRTPGEFLKAIKGKPVSVKLNSGVDYRGECTSTVLATNVSMDIYSVL